MNRKKGISIIMPIHNSENYLKKSIESVCCQNYKEWELILVENNSTDASLEICKQMAEFDNRIVVKICKEKGVSAARNLGIKTAKFENITFIDSDDIYDSKFVEKMIINNDIECNICFFEKFVNEDKINKNKKIKKINFSNMCEQISFLHKYDLFNTVWNKVYLKKIIEENNIMFDCELTIAEDLKFNLEYFKYVKKINILFEKLYNYRVNNDGLNLKIHKDRIQIRKKLYYFEKNMFIEKKFDLKSIYREYIKICLAELKQMNKICKTKNDKKNFYHFILTDELRQKELNEIYGNVSTINKVFVICFKNEMVLKIFAKIIKILDL